MDLVARLLLVSWFVVHSSHSLITLTRVGIQGTKERNTSLKTSLTKLSCTFTYIVSFISSITILLNIDFYKDIAATFLIYILVLGMFVSANFWKCEPEVRMQKLMVFSTNLSLCGGLLLFIVRS